MICSSRYYANSLGGFLGREEVSEIVQSARYNLADLLGEIYSAIAEKKGKVVCGDKSVGDIGFFPILNRVGLFASSTIRIVHLVRDIRAVYASLERLGWVKDRQVYPRSWNNANLSVFEILSGRDNYLLVRYEDLVSSPGKVLGQICGFLGFSYSPDMECHDVRGLEYVSDSFHGNLQKPWMPEQADKWRQELSDEACRRCEVQAAEAMAKFGYRPQGQYEPES